jgi:hypothetical protein
MVLSHTLSITEFMAANDGTLDDEDGDASDWIEIHNPTFEAVNLAGWSLSDDPDVLDKWQFPAGNLEGGEFLVVFASDKDRTDPASQLHTNFRLSVDGEFLALVQPDGVIAHAFDPEYPPQHEDVSYGQGTLQTDATIVIGPGSTWQYLDDGSDQGTAWREVAFDSSGWSSGPAQLGYGDGDEATVVSYGPNASDKYPTTYFRRTFDVSGVAEIAMLKLLLVRDDGAVVYINGQEVARDNMPTGSIHYRTYAVPIAAGESTFFEFEIPPSVLVEGENTIAVEIHQANAGSSDISFDLALESHVPRGEPQQVYFTDPTPGEANAEGFTGFAEPVTFSRSGGIFSTPFALELTSASPGDAIRYTLNGSTPTLASPAYSGPITINRTIMVRAGVFEEGVFTPVASETFVMVDQAVRDFSSNLPVVVINTFGRSPNDSVYTPVHSMFFNTTESGRAAVTGPLDFDGRGGLKLRGSSSLGFAKQNFAFETWDENNEDANHSILGLPSESDWVLHGPYSDKSLMRNYLSYGWSNEIGRYAPRAVFVELFLNDDGGNVSESDYHGVYVFLENIRRDGDRVDVEKLEPTHNREPEITGGYILKKDRLDPGDSGFVTQSGQRLAYVEPKEDEITPQQATYIRNYLNAFETALYGANFRDPETGYRQFIDVGSFIDHHIMVETMKNIDGFRLSTFMYKDRGGKLHMGPIWDYNLSLGNANYLQGWQASGWYYPQISSNEYPWYGRLFQDPDFRQEYIDRWYELRATVFATDEMIADIDAAAELLGEAQARNFDRWRILGQYVWPNWYVANTWAQEIDFMKNWLSDRLAWIDSQFPAPPAFNENGGEVEAGFELTIDHPYAQTDGMIFYTLDGSDPRLPGGGVSPAAVEYTGSITLTEDVVVRTRARRGAWSAINEAEFHVESAPELLPGDYNGNGLVEQADLDLVLAGWGRDASMLPDGWVSDPPSGTIDQGELDRVLANWGRTMPVAMADPPAPAKLSEATSAPRPAKARVAEGELSKSGLVKRSSARSAALDAVLGLRGELSAARLK